MKKLTIENAKSEAEQRGGKCLSKQFVSARTKLLWECSEGHQWETTLSHVRNNNNWCPVCCRRKYTLIDLQQHAKNKGGKCLSKEYLTSESIYKWKCNIGHTWENTFKSLLHSNTWCPKCLKNDNLVLAKKIAEKMGGQCLSKRYIQYPGKLKWQCAEGHQWKTTLSHVKDTKTWCPYCAGNKKLTIEKMRQIAIDQRNM